MSKLCSKRKKYLRHELLLPMNSIMELGSNKNRLLAKQGKFGLNFADSVFR